MARSRLSPVPTLLTMAVVVSATIVWFAWTLHDQQETLERNGRAEAADSHASRYAAVIRGRLLEVGERLSAWLANADGPLPRIDGTVVFSSAQGRVRLEPPASLPFVPTVARGGVVLPALQAAERLEFAGSDLAAAADAYERLRRHPDPSVQTEALFRLGRVYLRANRASAALAAYQQLGEREPADAGGYPAGFVALEGQRLALAAAPDPSGSARLAESLARGIDGGRWLLTRAEAEVARGAVTAAPRPQTWPLAEAMATAWAGLDGIAAERGLRVLESESGPVVLVWRTHTTGRILLGGFAARWLALPSRPDVHYELVDPAGIRIAGSSSPDHAVTSIVDLEGVPWTLRVWMNPPASAGPLGSTGNTIVGVAVLVTGLVWVTAYFTVRALRREARLATLQSDFVAAVSHEFRTPLTTIRHLAELLEMKEVPEGSRRATYYTTIASEARRLQRLIETLLDFGRIEAGTKRYRAGRVNVAALVRHVAATAESPAGHDAARLLLCGPEDGLEVSGDRDALAVALRNLIDNALKYSSRDSPVRLEWSRSGDAVVLRVIDRGPGVASAEREAIFERFVRGTAAAAAVVPGTGVGLALVRHVAAAHHGSVTVDSGPEGGSTFTLRLPIAI